MWSSDLFSVMIFVIILSIGDFISKKTKGIIISTLTVSIIYIAGYFSGLIPRNSIENIGLGKILISFGLMAVITNLGTMIELRKFLKEWKTVVVCVGSLILLGVAFVTIGSLLFGRVYALVAYPPIAGGSVSTIMISDAAIAAGQPMMSSFAWMLGILQFFIGLPLTSVLIKKYCENYLKLKSSQIANSTSEDDRPIRIRIFPVIPDEYNTEYVVLARLLIVTWLSVWLGGITPIPAAVLCLILGLLFCELGFLDRSSLQKSGMMGFIMLCMMASAPSSFSTLSLDELKGLFAPVIFFLLFGGFSLAVGGAIIGRIFKYDMRLSAALALSAMYGFPFSMMIPDQVIKSMQLSKEDANKLNEIVVPKMVIAGFTSVTICSVIIAAIVCPLAF